MITRIRRYASLNGAVHTHHFGATSGIPQGDPLSMLAAAALLGQWTLEIHQIMFLPRYLLMPGSFLAVVVSLFCKLFMLRSSGTVELAFAPEQKLVHLAIIAKMTIFGGWMPRKLIGVSWLLILEFHFLSEVSPPLPFSNLLCKKPCPRSPGSAEQS